MKNVNEYCQNVSKFVLQVGIILSTMLLIFQLGKTPYFGLQVASLRKVVITIPDFL